MSSCRPEVSIRPPGIERDSAATVTYLERLSIPVFDLVDGGHVAELMRKLVELFHSVRQPNGELLWRRCETNPRNMDGRYSPNRNWLAFNNVP